jgi:hypothetical protein
VTNNSGESATNNSTKTVTNNSETYRTFISLKKGTNKYSNHSLRSSVMFRITIRRDTLISREFRLQRMEGTPSVPCGAGGFYGNLRFRPHSLDMDLR